MALRNLLFTLPIVCSLVIAPGAAHAAWSGWVQCVITNVASGYINTETHTWFVVGATTGPGGTGSWSVAGQGHYDDSDQYQSFHQEWSVSGHDPNTRFVVEISAGMLSIEKDPQTGQSWQSYGYSGYGQLTRNGTPSAPTPLTGTAYEWPFWVEGPDTSTTLSGSRARTLMHPWGRFGGAPSTTTETCEWRLAGDGSDPGQPPPVNAPPVRVSPGDTRVTSVVSPPPGMPAANWPTATIQLGNGDLVGGGAQTNWTGNGNLLTATHPDPPGQGLWVGRGKDHWYPDPSTIAVYAIGLADPADHWEVRVFPETSQPSSTPVAVATLPPGYALTGGGCLLDWPPGAPGHLLTASYPASSSTWECRGKAHTIPSLRFPPGRLTPVLDRDAGAARLDLRPKATITSYVIGVRPKIPGLALPAVQIMTATSASASHPEMSVAGVANWTVTGGGALALPADPNGAGQLLTATMPTVAPGSSRPTGWYAKSKDHGVASPGTVIVYVISVKFY